MSTEVVRLLAIGLATLALWVVTVTVVVKHPAARWERAGRSKRFWAWAHLVGLLLGLAPVVSIAFAVGVWPRLHGAARSGEPVAASESPGASEARSAGLLHDELSGTEVMAVRRSHDGMGQLRRLTVEVDGRVVARLRQGEVAEVPVATGARILSARMDWLSSAPLEVRVEQGCKVRVALSIGAEALSVDKMLVHPDTAVAAEVVDDFPRW